ncbi:MAG TPA: phosphodiester glycosidase family protein [Candidatus Polarisedimenticolia bacterium]|jgi:uncharacterized protein YigE (DUF2233 family)
MRLPGIAILSLVLLALPGAPTAPAPWRTLAPGLEFRMIDGGAGCRKGSRDIAIVRVEPGLWRLDLHHASEDPNVRGGRDADEWRARTGAAVVFNASQYYPDHRPMGLFVKDGRNLGTRRITAWKGILAAEPAGAAGGARPKLAILDLDHDPFDPATTPYQVVLQSFMILDRDGLKRVRRSEWHANRTVVAVDRRERVLILVTAGAWTLWELADRLAGDPALDVRQAMSLDGGFESQMSLRAGGFDYLAFGQWHVDGRGDHSVPGLRVKLPAVVALYPRG